MGSAFKSMQDKLAVESNDFQALQKDLNRSMSNRQQFVQQYNENDMVFKELEKLEEDANVFKLIGPVLIKQDLVEAKSNVGKRLEFITNETERLDKMVKSLENKQETKHREITELQKKVQALAAQQA
uniref:Prefoldin subunit 6 n=1 Tax=Mantoniella antarctica TaxID=81844 RepID=A0A7S0SJH3_9CHLO